MPRTQIRTALKSQNRKRSIVVAGNHTSVSIDDAFWFGLKEAADVRGISFGELVTEIAERVAERKQINLSSALRTFVLEFYRDQVHQQRTKSAA